MAAGDPGAVLVLTGSVNDKVYLESALDLLRDWNIPHEFQVLSAHRKPDKLRALLISARNKGYRVVIAAAGLAAHLAGVCAAHTTLPVIAVPLAPESGTLGGLDALLAMVQMPSGVPVATVGINQGKNAAILAAQILAVSDENLSKRLENFKHQMAEA